MAGAEATSMFAGQPQPVEIHHRGIWYSGELVGWRHEANGRVAARVRCRVDGLRHSTWMDLADLRLPDPKHPPRREPYPAVVPRAAAPDEADATRPHAMLAGLGTRPAKPEHATAPPAPRVDLPRLDPPCPEEPAEPPRWTEPSPRLRRNQYLHQLDAYLTVV
jgi:hypothetical protein